MRVVRCDICDKEGDQSQIGRIVMYRDNLGDRPTYFRDICPDCQRLLAAYINNRCFYDISTLRAMIKSVESD